MPGGLHARSCHAFLVCGDFKERVSAGRDSVSDGTLRRLASLQQGDGSGRPATQAHHSCHVRADGVAARRRHVTHLCTARLRQPPL